MRRGSPALMGLERALDDLGERALGRAGLTLWSGRLRAHARSQRVTRMRQDIGHGTPLPGCRIRAGSDFSFLRGRAASVRGDDQDASTRCLVSCRTTAAAVSRSIAGDARRRCSGGQRAGLGSLVRRERPEDYFLQGATQRYPTRPPRRPCLAVHCRVARRSSCPSPGTRRWPHLCSTGLRRAGRQAEGSWDVP